MREEFARRSGVEWDLLTAEKIPSLTGEAELYATKWFDYRRMHPMQATFEFAHEYAEAHRHQYARRIDIHEARALNLQPIEQGEKHLLELWKGRRMADQLGIRYKEYCMYACDVAERSWKHLARPTDLVNSFLVEKVKDLWLQMLLVTIIYPEDEFYQMRNWVAHPDQVAWQIWVHEQIGLRNDSSLTLWWDGKKGDRALIRQWESLGVA